MLNFNKQIRISSTFKLAVSGMMMAIYIVIMYYTRAFAFGEYQVRLATSIYAFSALFPFLIVPLGLANALSNMLMGQMGIFDIVGGFAVGVITASVVYLIKKLKLSDYFIALPVILGPALIVPIWLSGIINVPYWTLVISLLIGQVLPGVLGVILVKALRNRI